MNTILKKIQIPAPVLQYWQQREPGERRMIGAFAIVVSIALIDLAIIEPVIKVRSQLRNNLPALRLETASFLRDLKQISGKDTQAKSLDDILRSLASGMPDHLQIDSSNGKSARLHLNHCEWKLVVGLLAQLQQKGVSITRMHVKATDAPDIIDADIEVTQ
ncbi:type II secretion system protein M [Burkholderiaceae bacterium DAT-1]|nr:type II secretion system protein M [Burkholderiaceae bacterium DAT-1]